MDEVIEEATACYGSRVKEIMSKLRYRMWLTKMAKKKVTATPKLKSLPPTSEAFAENVKRAHLQTCIWKKALYQDPPDLDPTDFGWFKDEASKSLSPVTMPKDVAPALRGVLEMIRCGCVTDPVCSTTRCGCSTAQLACTVFCGYHGTAQCNNQWTKDAAELSDEEDEVADEVDDEVADNSEM